jgi:hypothetical protein
MSLFVTATEETAVRAGAPLLERLGIRGLFREFGESAVKIATPKRILAGGAAISLYKYASGISQANVSLLPDLAGGLSIGTQGSGGQFYPGSGGGGGNGFYQGNQPTQGSPDLTKVAVGGGLVIVALAVVLFLATRKK